MTRCGIGPVFAVASVFYGLIAGCLTYLYPGIFLIERVPYLVFVIFGSVLLVAGVVIYVVALRTFNKGYRVNELVTGGVFSVVRHPIYAAWILLIIPGMVLFFKSWLLMGAPFVGYLVFKRYIRKEDEYLQNKFCKEYLRYRSKVGELFPFCK